MEVCKYNMLQLVSDIKYIKEAPPDILYFNKNAFVSAPPLLPLCLLLVFHVWQVSTRSLLENLLPFNLRMHFQAKLREDKSRLLSFYVNLLHVLEHLHILNIHFPRQTLDIFYNFPKSHEWRCRSCHHEILISCLRKKSTNWLNAIN